MTGSFFQQPALSDDLHPPQFPTSTAPPPLKTSQDRSSDRGLSLKRPGASRQDDQISESEHRRSLHKDVLWPAPPQEGAGVNSWSYAQESQLGGRSVRSTSRYASVTRQTDTKEGVHKSSIRPVREQPPLKVGEGYGRGPPGWAEESSDCSSNELKTFLIYISERWLVWLH